ncbi:P-selectin-like [Patiria miniata]|uniref:Sushi domain-containing protein n=1 Tax=Patiria miniata TaxID=46514 RepID=A0A913Z6R4_PATMI|nr:P-selectin-like [Patiria miniata]
MYKLAQLAIGCSVPERPWNGKEVRFDRRKRQLRGRAFFKCKSGFQPVGPRTKTCSKTQRGLEWTGGIIECRAENSCQSPGVLHGANWTLVESDRRSRHDDASFSPNTKIDVACWPGFVSIVGLSQITCGMSGEWSSPMPTCREVICTSLLESEAEISHLQKLNN